MIYRTPETSLLALSKGDRSEAKTLRSEENVHKTQKGNINKRTAEPLKVPSGGHRG